ncbi:MAG: hypothetical protein LBH91_02565 [Prevotellaceae bacterium]|jgi:hypothetical protein|nr:hypothetical protein [Prevotellaceae bacterium]
MEKKEENTEGKQTDERKAIYAPMEEIKCIERVFVDLITTRDELQKVSEGMIIVNNE